MIKEMEKLVNVLVEMDINFQVGKNMVGGTPQIFIPDATNPVLDFICHKHSYGYAQDLMECYDRTGNIIGGEDDVRGWLDCEEATKIVVEMIRKGEYHE